MRAGFLPAAAAFAGCDGPAEYGDTGSPEPGGAMPAYCDEGSAVAVADASVTAEGFDFAAGAVIDANAGEWAGTFAWAGAGTDYAGFTMAISAEGIEAVTQVLIHPSASDTGLASGAPDPVCPSYYRIPAALQFRLGGDVLNEAWTVDLEASSASTANWSTSTALDHIAGSLRPSSFDPDDWVTTELTASAYRQEGAFIVSLGWLASNSSAERSRAPRTPGARKAAPKGESGGATATVSGMVETVGTLTAERL